jgi:hypothetical protein
MLRNDYKIEKQRFFWSNVLVSFGQSKWVCSTVTLAAAVKDNAPSQSTSFCCFWRFGRDELKTTFPADKATLGTIPCMAKQVISSWFGVDSKIVMIVIRIEGVADGDERSGKSRFRSGNPPSTVCALSVDVEDDSSGTVCPIHAKPNWKKMRKKMRKRNPFTPSLLSLFCER